MAALSGSDPERCIKLLKKHKLDLYAWSNVAYICKSDGSLGEKDKQHLRKRAKGMKSIDHAN